MIGGIGYRIETGRAREHAKHNRGPGWSSIFFFACVLVALLVFARMRAKGYSSAVQVFDEIAALASR